MAALNSKNKKYIESLKRELGEVNTSFDKLRNDSARELAKIRHQLSVSAGYVRIMCSYLVLWVMAVLT